MIDVEQTIISQYANSPILVRLIQDMNEWIDPRTDFDNFFNFIWNVDTAQGFGLDIWGRIVGVSRYVQIPPNNVFFGFQAGGEMAYQPFNQASFFTKGEASNNVSVVPLNDVAFRTLILVKALANISNCSARSINTLLRNLFVGRGITYVKDLGGMQIQYIFNFMLLPYEQAILIGSGVLLKPAGVGVSIMFPGNMGEELNFYIEDQQSDEELLNQASHDRGRNNE